MATALKPWKTRTANIVDADDFALQCGHGVEAVEDWAIEGLPEPGEGASMWPRR